MTEHLFPDEGGQFDIDALADRSLEDIRPLLSDIEEELRRAGHDSEESKSELPPEIDISEWLAELQKRETESHIKPIRERLRQIGLHDPDSLTSHEVSRLDSDSILQIDQRNIESLFYFSSIKSGKMLGRNYPVTWSTLRQQIYSLGDENSYRKSVDLDMFQLQEWVNAQNYLIGIGVDPQDLAKLTGSGENCEKRPEAKQNANRLSYLLQSEPILKDFVVALPGWTEKRGKPTVHKASKMALVVLRLKTERIQKQKKYSIYKNEFDAVDEEVYKITLKRLQAKTNIAKLIIDSTSYKSADAFLKEFS